ncbi:MAG: hypothetical protein IRZ03_08300 [Acidobacterium ailaaui]|nr:hypothetical protein [Pseudacidobacterium ailaaui]
MNEEEVRILALELNPIVDFGFNYPDGRRLSEIVEKHGWKGAADYPEVRTFMDNLREVTRVHVAHALADAGMLIGESVPERCVCGTELAKCPSCGDDRCPRCDPGECRPESEGK